MKTILNILIIIFWFGATVVSLIQVEDKTLLGGLLWIGMGLVFTCIYVLRYYENSFLFFEAINSNN